MNKKLLEREKYRFIEWIRGRSAQERNNGINKEILGENESNKTLML